MIKGAIFDLDGTLLDSMFIWDTIGEDYLRTIGYEPKEKLNETFKNLSLQQAACYYISEYGVTLTVDEIVDGVNKMIEKYYIDEVRLKPGVKELLQKFKDSEVKMCIATATDIHLVKAALERLSIDRYFSEIFTCSSVGLSLILIFIEVGEDMKMVVNRFLISGMTMEEISVKMDVSMADLTRLLNN